MNNTNRTSNQDLLAELEAAAAKWVLEKNKYTLGCLRDARAAVLRQMTPDETSGELERLRELQEKALALDDAVAEFGIDKPQHIAEVYQAFHDVLHDGHGAMHAVEPTEQRPRSLAEEAHTLGRQQPSKLHDAGSSPAVDAIRCPKCQSADTLPLTFDVLECQSCGHEFARPLKAAPEPKRKRLRDSDAAFNLGVLPTEQPSRIESGAPRGEAGDRAGPQVSPLPPEVLADAQQDVVHVEDGPVRAGRAVKASEKYPIAVRVTDQNGNTTDFPWSAVIVHSEDCPCGLCRHAHNI